MRRRVLVLVNPAAASGRALAAVQRVMTALDSHGCTCRQAHSQQGGHLTELARDLAPSCDLLLAAGGDGTVREVASGLLAARAPETVLGVLPFGTGNDFATQLSMAEPESALKALLGGRVRALDVIEVRHGQGAAATVDHALLFAATGFAVEVLRRTSPRVKRLFGRRFSYSVGFFRALLGFRAPTLTIDAEGKVWTGPVFHVGAGNAEWAGGGAMRLSPGARMDDGQLEMCRIEALGRIEVLQCFPMLLRGTFPRHPNVRYFKGRELSVVSEPAMPLALDGDVMGQTPATFRVLAGALRVVTHGG
jgi:diacylglycerol kinase (ATP)